MVRSLRGPVPGEGEAGEVKLNFERRAVRRRVRAVRELRVW